MSDDDLDADDDMRRLMEDSLLKNQISTTTFREFVQKAKRCKIKGISKLAKIKEGKHLKRDVFRAILKHRRVEVPMWYVDLPLQGGSAKIPFILPHLIIKKVESFSLGLKPLMFNPSAASSSSGSVELSLFNRVKATAADLGLAPETAESVIGLGLHGDGTPYGKKDSLEVLSLNFSFCEEHRKLRIPLIALPQRHMTAETWNVVLETIAWSFKILAHGRVFEGPGFSDPLNKKALGFAPAGTLVPRSFLVQLRADWAFLKICYKLPQHNENIGICHLCRATPQNWMEFDDDATWRSQRFTVADSFHKHQQEKKIKPCPLWQIPGVSCALIDLDWLHAADLGVAADIAGNVFEAVLPHMAGTNNSQRVDKLRSELEDWYKSENISEKIDRLKLESWRTSTDSGKAGAPKLKAKAAAIRHLVPFLHHIARKTFLDPDDQYGQAIVALTSNLSDAYDCLNNWNQAKLATSVRKTLKLYKSLRQHALRQDDQTKKWHLKPKCHVWLEMAEYESVTKGNPKHSWCYKDEDFGGYLVKVTARRGGRNVARSVSLNVYERFFALNRLPKFF